MFQFIKTLFKYERSKLEQELKITNLLIGENGRS